MQHLLQYLWVMGRPSRSNAGGDIGSAQRNRFAFPDASLLVMQELIDEHVFGRRTTKALVEANDRYRNGDASALEDIAAQLRALVDFYPRHIAKEDKVFFPASRQYFTDAEDQAMLEEFHAFDRNMIHEKYKSVVAAAEAG